MASHTDLNKGDSNVQLLTKYRVLIALGIASLVLSVLAHWLPVLAISVPMIGLSALGYWLAMQWQQEQVQRRRRQAKLDAVFYQLMRQQQGRVSALDFAMSTQLNGAAAQAYLNEQAQAFAAYCETTLDGNIVYVFNLAAVHRLGAQVTAQRRATQAEAAWAYSEKARAEKVRIEQAQVAWANAKQIRTLHQLSQKGTPAASKGAPKKLAPPSPKLTSSPAPANIPSATASEGIRAGYIAITPIEEPSRHNRQDNQAVKRSASAKAHASKTHAAQRHSSRTHPSAQAKADRRPVINLPGTDGATEPRSADAGMTIDVSVVQG
ncbi:MAG: hypothetical protein AAF050_20560 [Cyanobacteria bacterium J06649_5]